MDRQRETTPQPLIFRSPRGQLIAVREAQPADLGALAELLGRLSERTIQLRYMHLRRLTPGAAWSEAERMTQARSPGHTTLLASIRHGDHDELVAVAELVRDRHNPVAGEIALVVRDDLQQQRIGSFLLWRLIRVAQRDGITRLSANMLAENRGMLQLIRALGLPATITTRYGETEAQITLPGPAQSLRARRASLPGA